MKKIDLGQAITIIANVGVIAGILFLALELRQNNEFAEAQQRFNHLSLAAEGGAIVAQSPDLADAMAKSPTEQTPRERILVQSWFARLVLISEWSYRELPREDLGIVSLRGMLGSPSGRVVWEQLKASVDEEFAEFIEKEVLSEDPEQ